jgi:zinc D-Ala-D-Ala carboxypeptidase
MTDAISTKDTSKIPYTGHYLFKGKPQEMYKEIHNIIGDSIILTSGARSIVKQMYLFVNKCVRTKENLSIASHSLAPPGYSYHGIGDFDVGKVGYGYRNFTADFAKTDEYKKLMDLGYIKIRYTQDNPCGVRYEPWHIKVV